MSEASTKDRAFQYRGAIQSDAAGVGEVIEEVAPEIPVSVDTDDQKGRMTAVIVQCCRSGKSWVATDDKGKIVGVALVSGHRYTDGTLHLYYVGVLKDERGCGVFTALMEKLMDVGAPITAAVRHDNQSSMVDRLENLGFTKTATKDDETEFKWEASPSE
jgi:ribosomal protein S18 acetylase RimI-like enzyme